MRRLTQLEKALIRFDAVCREEELRYAVIGGFALLLYGSRRPTLDVDATILLNVDEIRAAGRAILKHFKPRHKHPIEFFERYFVLPVLYEPTNTRIDIGAGVGGFERSAILRAVKKNVAGIKVPVARVEDLIIYKLVARRPHDLLDAGHLVKKYRSKLDTAYLKKQAKAFREIERSDVLETLTALLTKKGHGRRR
ncbi:MAG: nucleotidyl transferase AbiEii/AbiGii toxin family protein [Bacteroidota bacterium]